MLMTICTSGSAGEASNCVYPNRVSVVDAGTFKDAISQDHVCGIYKDNYRSVGNFISSDVIPMDIDNDHSEDSDEWITADKLKELFEDVTFLSAPSRNHMKQKNGKGPRPRLHVYFPIDVCADADKYSLMKKSLQSEYPFFDSNCLDAGRFIFGADVEEVTINEGWLTVEDMISQDYDAFEDTPQISGTIVEGSRNNTMSRFAGRVLKKLGNTEKAYQVFLETADKCDPPLPEHELTSIWNSALKFYEKVASQDDYVPPDEYNSAFGDMSLKPDDFSDIGEAKVLAREYKEELIFTNATDYLRHDGTAWIEDRQMAIGATEEFLDLQLADAQQEVEVAKEELLATGLDEQLINAGGRKLEKECEGIPEVMPLVNQYLAAVAYLKFVLKCRNYKNIVAIQNTAKPMLAIDVSELDKDPLVINTPVATYELEKGVAGFREHDPKDLITKITTCSPGDEGRDIWKEALDTFFCGNQELIDYVQLIVGVAAIGKVYQEHMIIAYGDGANGKSTFWNTIFRVLGTYSGKISAESLTVGYKRNAKPEMAELKGKRLIIASELEEGTRLNTALVKQLCSTDEIQAEKKYRDPFHFVPSHTLVLYTNHLPRVSGNDNGIWRRLVVIPFSAKITGGDDKKNYADYLYENAGPAIMSWIIEGAKKAVDAEFKMEIPKVVQDAIDAYREDNDWLGEFISSKCDVESSMVQKSGELYKAYRAHALDNGEYVRSTTDFYAALEKIGFSKHKTNQGAFIYGLKLKEGQEFLD